MCFVLSSSACASAWICREREKGEGMRGRKRERGGGGGGGGKTKEGKIEQQNTPLYMLV